MNRGNYQYLKQKKAYLKAHEQHGGWWVCKCGKWTQEPELDHIDNTGMGGSPKLLLDENNWQILCNNCHRNKTNELI